MNPLFPFLHIKRCVIGFNNNWNRIRQKYMWRTKPRWHPPIYYYHIFEFRNVIAYVSVSTFLYEIQDIFIFGRSFFIDISKNWGVKSLLKLWKCNIKEMSVIQANHIKFKTPSIIMSFIFFEQLPCICSSKLRYRFLRMPILNFRNTVSRLRVRLEIQEIVEIRNHNHILIFSIVEPNMRI